MSIATTRGGKRAIEATVSGAVSTGIKPMLASNNPPLKKRAQDAFLNLDRPVRLRGPAGLSTAFEADLLRNVLVDGEALLRALAHGPRCSVPLELKLLGPEYLDRSRVIVGKKSSMASNTTPWVAVWPTGLYPHHPASFVNFQSVRVDAANVVHVFSAACAGRAEGAFAF